MKGRTKSALLVAAAAVAATALVAPGFARDRSGPTKAPASDKPVKVRVMDNFFDPRSRGVLQGGTVKFVWKGTNRHNVRFTKVPPGASRRGSRTKTRGNWSRSFGKPGLYRYVCTLFDGMKGTITVKPPTPGAS